MLCNNDNVSNILKKNPKLQMRRYDPGVVLLNSLSLSLCFGCYFPTSGSPLTLSAHI